MEHFITHYEQKHMRVIFEVTGPDDFPSRHTWHYIHRSRPDGTSTAFIPGLPPTVRAEGVMTNYLTPATLYKGRQDQVEFDCISEIEFRDKEHFKAFYSKVTGLEGKRRLDEDQKFFQVMEQRFVVLEGEKNSTTVDDFRKASSG